MLIQKHLQGYVFLKNRVSSYTLTRKFLKFNSDLRLLKYLSVTGKKYFVKQCKYSIIYDFYRNYRIYSKYFYKNKNIKLFTKFKKKS